MSIQFRIKDKVKRTLFTQMIQSISMFSNEISFQFELDKLYIQGMDHSHILLFEIDLQKKWFDHYTINKPVCVNISLKSLSKILNMKWDDHIILLDYKYDAEDVILIMKSDTTFTSQFTLPLFDIDNEIMTIPEIKYQCSLQLNSLEMKKITNQLLYFSDIVKIIINKNIVKFESASEDLGKNKIKIPKQLCDIFTLEDDIPFESHFNLKYLQKCLSLNFTEKVNFYLMDSNPLQIKFTLDDNTSNIRFFLAPNIDV